jgi:hypothetical protein
MEAQAGLIFIGALLAKRTVDPATLARRIAIASVDPSAIPRSGAGHTIATAIGACFEAILNLICAATNAVPTNVRGHVFAFVIGILIVRYRRANAARLPGFGFVTRHALSRAWAVAAKVVDTMLAFAIVIDQA